MRMIEIENQSGSRVDRLGQNEGGNGLDDIGGNNGVGDTVTVTKLKDVGEKSSYKIALKIMSYYVCEGARGGIDGLTRVLRVCRLNLFKSNLFVKLCYVFLNRIFSRLYI